MYSLLLLVNIIAGAGVIGLVLVQHGKGADMGAAFGSGSSGSLFGATGSSNFLSKMTSILAAVFILTCLGLNYVAGKSPVASGSVVDSLNGQVVVPEVPVAPASPTDGRTSDIPK